MIPGRSPTPSPFDVGEAARVDLVDDAALPPVVTEAGRLDDGSHARGPHRRSPVGITSNDSVMAHGPFPEADRVGAERVRSTSESIAHVRHRPDPARPGLPGRLLLGLRRLGLPDRGRRGGGRQRSVDLGHLFPQARRDRRRQHGRRRLRPLPPLPGGRQADGRARGTRLPLQHQLVARPAHRDRRHQPARPRLLRAPRRRPARRRRPAAGQPVPLGPAAGAPGSRRLRQPGGRRLVHRLRCAACVEPG